MMQPYTQRDAIAAFTLFEVLLAVTITALVMTAAVSAFVVAMQAWRVSLDAGDGLHHADYVAEQLVMGLRSAYYPDDNRPGSDYGVVITDAGSGENAQDTISWTKLGTSLIGGNSSLAGTPHRIEVSVIDGTDDEPGGLAIRAWRLFGQDEDFDPDESVEPIVLSSKIVGFDCSVRDPMSPDDDIEWLVGEEWETTNKIPPQVEFSLYIVPPREGDDPIEVKRIVEMPLSALSFLTRRSPAGRPGTGAPGRVVPRADTGRPLGRPAQRPAQRPGANIRGPAVRN